jgi:hypothetical protein
MIPLNRFLSFFGAFVVFLGAFVGFLTYERGQVQAEEPAAPGVTILYDFKFAQPAYRYDLNDDQIGSLRSDGQSTEDGRVLGLTVADFDLGSSYRFDYRHSWLDSNYSLWLNEVTVQFGYKSLTVYVTNRYDPNTCAFKTTLSHENDHVNIHRNLYLKYQLILRQAMENNPTLPDEARPFLASSLEEGKAQIERKISAILDPIFQQFRQEVADDQGSLDTPDNYYTLHNQCSDW